MRLFRHLWNIPESARGAAIALGNFDGLHLGHKQVVGEALRIAAAEKIPSAVLTFEPHPREFFRPDLPSLRLMSFAEKARMLKNWGVDHLYVARFDARFVKLTAQQFMDELLTGSLGARHIVTGQDFGFGQGRGGTRASLEQAAASGKFRYTAIAPELSAGGEKISSSQIRSLLGEGRAESAALLLGRPHRISGRVIRGDARGRELGYPTANMRLTNRFLPKFGIYIVRTEIDGKIFHGVASLGIRPMFETSEPLFETYLFDFNDNLYGKKLSIELLHYLRPEAVFSGIDALKTQIGKDCEAARNWIESKND